MDGIILARPFRAGVAGIARLLDCSAAAFALERVVRAKLGVFDPDDGGAMMLVEI